jgi:hypothetical protein
MDTSHRQRVLAEHLSDKDKQVVRLRFEIIGLVYVCVWVGVHIPEKYFVTHVRWIQVRLDVPRQKIRLQKNKIDFALFYLHRVSFVAERVGW